MEDTKIGGLNTLNNRAQSAIDNANIFLRIEECILNARTDLAKRRLVRAAIVLGGYLAMA